jgi:hypothetical protein
MERCLFDDRDGGTDGIIICDIPISNEIKICARSFKKTQVKKF